MRRRKKKSSRIANFIKAAVIVTIIGLVLRIFVVTPYRVKNSHMEDTLKNGDFFLVSQLSYRSAEPEVGDVIVFQHPFKVDENRVGRVIGIAGQTVEISEKSIYIDNEPFKDFEKIKHVDFNILPFEYSNRDYSNPVSVPPGKVFVLCDNRDDCEDSRNFGVVNIDDIRGKGLFVYWSWKPDPNSPEWESPYILPAVKILFYNLFHFPSRIGWSRIGAATE